MTLKQQKIISAVLIAIAVFGGLEALAVIINLNQSEIYLHVAFWVYVYLVVKIALLYDLHFKNPGALARAKQRHESVPHWLKRGLKIIISALADRLLHLRRWSYLKHFQNYLLLPGLIYWSTVTLLYLNLGRQLFQQIFIVLSSLALIVAYWYLKEIFYRKREVVDHDVFVALSVVKLYTAFALFSAVLGITRFFCLEPKFITLGVFSLTTLLVYQALFQHRAIRLGSLLVGMVIGGLLALTARWIYIDWGYNYFTGGAFLMIIYNFWWGLYHHYLDKTLTAKTFWELLFLTALLLLMVAGVTNFKARIIGDCRQF